MWIGKDTNSVLSVDSIGVQKLLILGGSKHMQKSKRAQEGLK